MPENIYIVALNDSLNDVVSNAVGLLNSAQNEFSFQIASPSRPLPKPDLQTIFSWDQLGSILSGEKEKLRAKYIFGILDQPIENNWFSRTLAEDRISFVTTKDWEYLSYLPLVSFVAYEIAENLIEMLLDDFIAHDETRGCIFDMVGIKPEISFKIRTADICPDCMDRLSNCLSKTKITALIAMLEKIRLFALGRGEQSTSSTESSSILKRVDSEFPFPIAYCFRSMQTELSYSRKWFKALELYEVILKYISFVLLATIHEDKIKPSDQIGGYLKNLKRPSTGHWHTVCFQLLKFLKNELTDTSVNGFLTAIDKSLLKSAYQASEKFLPLRNDTRGHGFVEGESRYKLLYEQNLHHLQTLVELVAPLANFPLLKVGEGLQRRQGIINFPAKILMGSHPLFPVEKFQTDKMVDTDCLFHIPDQNRFISLYPWFLMNTCSECHREVIFLYDKTTGTGVIMREYPTNHTQEHPELFMDVSKITG